MSIYGLYPVLAVLKRIRDDNSTSAVCARTLYVRHYISYMYLCVCLRYGNHGDGREFTAPSSYHTSDLISHQLLTLHHRNSNAAMLGALVQRQRKETLQHTDSVVIGKRF